MGSVGYTEGDYLDVDLPSVRSQWRSIAQRAVMPRGQRQVAFVPVETLLCLAAMFLVEYSRFGSSSHHRAPSPVPELARLFRRPPSSIIAKMANLDGTRSHGAKHDLVAGTVLRADPEHLAMTYRIVLAGARAEGVSTADLPDFLGIEHGGDLALLGQEELTTSDVGTVLEREIHRWVSRQTELTETETERLFLASMRVGQHRFARGVLLNCGSACVFCGFAVDSGERPTLLRAGHIKPWKDSESRERLDVTNGLAACPTHDAAFDAGLLGVDRDLNVRISPVLQRAAAQNPAVQHTLTVPPFRPALTLPPAAQQPSARYLDWHMDVVYARG